jgi:hypothetical protein
VDFDTFGIGLLVFWFESRRVVQELEYLGKLHVSQAWTAGRERVVISSRQGVLSNGGSAMPINVYFAEDIAGVLESHQRMDEETRRYCTEIPPKLAAFLAGRESQRVALATAFGLLPEYLMVKGGE